MISTRGRYAIRILIDIAINSNNNFLSSKEISNRQSIPIKYLENIIKILVKNNFLIPQRGKTGGYKLATSPENINIFDVLILTEINVNCVKCEINGKPCPRKESCYTLPMWEKFNKITKDFFSNITIKDLISRNI